MDLRSETVSYTHLADEGTNNSLSPIFIIKAGEILESQGKKDEALKLYQDAKKKYVNAMRCV